MTSQGVTMGNKHQYFGAIYLQNIEEILAYTYNGAMHSWKKSDGEWKPALTMKGHFREVTDLDWDTNE